MKTPGHRVAKEDAWPWQAVIYVQSAVKCGGTLIADNWVLTAAKCFNGKKIKNLTNYHVEIALGMLNKLSVCKSLNSKNNKSPSITNTFNYFQVSMIDLQMKEQNNLTTL